MELPLKFQKLSYLPKKPFHTFTKRNENRKECFPLQFMSHLSKETIDLILSHLCWKIHTAIEDQKGDIAFQESK